MHIKIVKSTAIYAYQGVLTATTFLFHVQYSASLLSGSRTSFVFYFCFK